MASSAAPSSAGSKATLPDTGANPSDGGGNSNAGGGNNAANGDAHQLPQTGDATTNESLSLAGVIGLATAAFLGLFGLGRKHDSED
ncbi:LPXTG cell wall anchor domain-containing protein [Lacticaseibacillus pantheris]|uniref:LPXTG cell wall anchor domain-containing protein n=1 Tax=Lacticaseibacillus pantheris TaxID=171523 RepID=UPI00138F11F0